MQLETIIGLEIHAQVNTKTGMFCACDNDSFGVQPNKHICPICMGHPGQLPVPNEEVIRKAIAAGLALGCTVNERSIFDRKHYFYPDLVMGYQITQNDHPIASQGNVKILVDGEEKEMNITRMHLENDAGKLTHVSDGSLCDYNRSGTPLMEIVTEPDMRSPREARILAENIQAILRYVNASDCDMEKGMMRFDASVSLRPIDARAEDYPDYYQHPRHGVLFPRVEIKNLNSFRSLEAALEYEIKRLTELWDAGDHLRQEQTVGWIDDDKETKLLRDKESAADYRYFPEPDIPPVILSETEIDTVRKDLPELPYVKYQRYRDQLQISESDALFLVSDHDLAKFFENVVNFSGDVKASLSWVLSILVKYLKDYQHTVADLLFSAADVAEIINLVKAGEISGKIAKDVFPIMYETGKSPQKIIEEKGWKQVSDTNLIQSVVEVVIANNPQSVEDYHNGKDKALGFLVGQVMKQTKGQANPQIVNEALRAKLSK